jgi:hypothetical protein
MSCTLILFTGGSFGVRAVGWFPTDLPQLFDNPSHGTGAIEWERYKINRFQ